MLPTSGYLKVYNCPYFYSGLCERPHCHYRHVKPDTNQTCGLIKPARVSIKDDPVLQRLKDVNDAISRVKEAVIQSNATVQGTTSYVPTPIGSKDSSASGRHHIAAQGVPQYKPTPLVELRKLHQQQNEIKVPPTQTSKKSRKLEYDPTLVKPKFICAQDVHIEHGTHCKVEENVESREQNLNISHVKVENQTLTESNIENTVAGATIALGNAITSLPLKKEAESQAAILQDAPKDNENEFAPSHSVPSLPEVKKECKSVDCQTDIIVIPQRRETVSCTATTEEDTSVSESEYKSKSKKTQKKKLTHRSVKKKRNSCSESSSDISEPKQKKSKAFYDSSSNKPGRKPPKIGNDHLESSPSKTGEHKHKKVLDVKEQGKQRKDSTSESDSPKMNKMSSLNQITEKHSRNSKDCTSCKTLNNDSGPHKTLNHKSLDQSSSHSKNSSNHHDKNKSSISNTSRLSKHKSKPVSRSKSSKLRFETEPADSKESQNHKVVSVHNREGKSANSSYVHKHDSSLRRSSSAPVSEGSSGLHSKPLRQFAFEKHNSVDIVKNSIGNKMIRKYSSSVNPGSSKLNSSDNAEDSECELACDADCSDTDIEDPDVIEECLRIFNESNSVNQASEQEKEPEPVEVSSNQIRLNHYEKINRMYMNGHKEHSSAFLSSVMQANHSLRRKSIAHIPNALLMAAVKKQAPPPSPGITPTKAQPSRNRAQASSMLVLPKRPVIKTEPGNKVPVDVRQRYLNLFIDALAKRCTSSKECFSKALEEEKNAYDRSANKSIYLNVAINTLKRIRREVRNELAEDEFPSESGSPSRSTDLHGNKRISHAYVLGGARAARTSFSIEKNRFKLRNAELTESSLYELLKPYILKEKELEANSYPRPHPKKADQAILHNIDIKKYCYNTGLTRRCCRCSKTFTVTEEGTYVRDEECVYHWGKVWKKRIAGSIESRHTCCEGDLETQGCCVAKGHVYNGCDPNYIGGFVTTLPKAFSTSDHPGVFSIDCEMCYTTGGWELARVTVVNFELKPVFEALVKPENPILDCNTRFSGIKEEDLMNATTTLGDVQAILLSLFCAKTILIGHSLESDLTALKLIHSCVVDTALVFPHRRGLPFKRALRTLAGEYLQKIIQNDVSGHDSLEDAMTCMELMLIKVKEDMKKRR